MEANDAVMRGGAYCYQRGWTGDDNTYIAYYPASVKSNRRGCDELRGTCPPVTMADLVRDHLSFETPSRPDCSRELESRTCIRGRRCHNIFCLRGYTV